MDVWYAEKYSIPLVRQFPEYLWVFGDNVVGRGKGGQAIIRDEPNAFGIPTKRLPRTSFGSYFVDEPKDRNNMLLALRELWKEAQRRPIVFPTNGIGTGLAKMNEHSPLLYEEMCRILQTHFGIRNGEYDKIKLLRRHL